MKNFNLLPRESGTSKETTKAYKILKKIAVVLTGVFVVASVAGGGAFFYFNNSLQTLRNEEVNLKTNIESLQATEGRLVLLKDRLAKIQNIVSQRSKESTLGKHKLIVSELPGGVDYRGTDLELSNSTLTITSASSRSTQELINLLQTQNTFTSLTLTSMTYNPFTGYELKLDVR